MPRARKQQDQSSLLGSSHYDDDATSVQPGQDSDSEDEHPSELSNDAGDTAGDDHAILKEEEEREELLTGPSSRKGKVNEGYRDENTTKQSHWEKMKRRREKRRARKSAKKGNRDENRELMFEMEEGGPRSEVSSLSSRSSMEPEREKPRSTTRSRRIRMLHFILITVVLIILFLLLLYGAYKQTKWSRSRKPVSTLSNGTSEFAPTTILISLDGFRADFLNRGLTPTLNAFIADGVSPKYMLPSFPSVTFPNHYTLVTGLYPESHGVVGNTFWDPDLKEEFYYTDPTRSMQPKWWSRGEPIWVTAERQNIHTAIHMWPGSEAHIHHIEPTFVDKFNGSEILSRKVDKVLQLLDLPGFSEPGALSPSTTRPNLIAAYVPNIDVDGHKYGPNSTHIRETISKVDGMLNGLFSGLEERNLTDVVNIIVVSDHGMATTSTERLIQLDDLIDTSLIEHIDGWPLYGLRPKVPSDLHRIYDQLSEAASKTPNFEVYLRDENMPERYHFTKSDRIAPLWIVPKTGWAIVKRDDFNVEAAKENGDVYAPRGLHGYDHEHPLMRALFVARGPAFPHKPNSKLEVFQNTEVYNIVCDSIGIVPNSNNGTLRLPLKPVGLHSDSSNTPNESPEDPPPSSSVVTTSSPTDVPSSPTTTAPSDIGVDKPDPSPPDRPIIDNNAGKGGESDEDKGTKGKDDDDQSSDAPKWLDLFIAKVEAAKQWMKEHIHIGRPTIKKPDGAAGVDKPAAS